MPEQQASDITKMLKKKVANSSETETQTEDVQPEAPFETPENPKKGFCSCTIVKRYKKPMVFVVVILLLILNTTMVVVGIIQCYSSPCPIELMIPIYLVGAGMLSGIIGIISRILFIVKHCRSSQSIIINRTLYGLLIAELIFFIIGSYWIFSSYEEKMYSCNSVAFTWAFLILIFNYLIILSPIVIPCCIESFRCCIHVRTWLIRLPR